MKNYGLKNPDGTSNKARKDHISAVIVSLLQAGAFFGALISAPISGKLVCTSRAVRAFETFSVLPHEQLTLDGRNLYSCSVLSSRSVL